MARPVAPNALPDVSSPTYLVGGDATTNRYGRVATSSLGGLVAGAVAPVYDTLSDADGAPIASSVEAARTVGYAAVDDGGGSDFAEGPALEIGGFTAADGRHFEIIRAPANTIAKFGIRPEDNTAAALINDAMEWMFRRNGGGVLDFLPEKYQIDETILRTAHNVFLRGSGHSWHSNILAGADGRWDQFKGTRFRWTGGADKMVVMRPAVGASEPALVGGGMDGIILDGNGVATHCLEILSLRGGRFPTLFVADAITNNLHIGVVDSGDIAATEPRDTQHCQFDRILTRSWLAAALSAKGIVLDGDDVADVSVCQFGEIAMIHMDGTGLELNSSDACTFGTVFGFRIPGGTANGVRIIGGSSVTDFPRKHHFNYMQPGPGGLRVVANTVAPKDNTVVTYSLGNGTPEPVVDMGCSLPVHMYDTGALVRQQAHTAVPVFRQYRGDQIASAFIGDLEAEAWDSAGNLDRITRIRHWLQSNTSGAENGRIYFGTVRAGTFAERAYIGDGLSLGGGQEITSVFSATAALDFPSVAAGGTQTLTMTVTGAVTGMPVAISLPAGGGHGALSFTAWVSAADTVSVRAHNGTAGAIDPAALSIRAVVFGF